MGVVSRLPIASSRHRLIETPLLTLGAPLCQSMVSTLIINLYNAIYCKLLLMLNKQKLIIILCMTIQLSISLLHKIITYPICLAITWLSLVNVLICIVMGC